MRIALLGATGRTGRQFVQQALAAGHQIVAYARRPQALDQRPGLRVVGGQLDDTATLTAAVAGCDAIVVALGSKLLKGSTRIMEMAVPQVIAAARGNGITRVVVLSALGVGATLVNTRHPYRLGCRTIVAAIFRDHHAGESQLVDSGLVWTTVHPGPLLNGPRTPHPLFVDAASGDQIPGIPRTTRADVAAVMLAALDDPTTYDRQMLVTSAVQTA